MFVIASIIFLALIIAAVGGGCLILARHSRHLRSLLDIGAASPFALRYLRGLGCLRGLAGRPTNKPARRPTKKPAFTAYHNAKKYDGVTSESLFESKIHLSQQNIGPKSSPSR